MAGQIQYVDFVNGSDTVATISISGATRANPCVITSNAHGLGNGQWIHIASVVGMTQLNSNTYKTANVAANTFELQDLSGNNVNSSAFTAYTSGGTVTQWRKIPITSITKANPAVVTAKKHGFSNGQTIIMEVNGMVEVNNKAYTVANATTDTFELSGINSSAYTTFTDGYCTRPFLTMNYLESWRAAQSTPRNRFYENGDSVYFAKTFTKDATIQIGSGNIVFTRNSTTVTTSVDLRASISVGDYIGLTSATMMGCSANPTVTRPDIYYKVMAITAATITLECKYGATTTTVSTINRLRIGTEIRTTGNASATAITTAGIGMTYEGSYDFVHNTAVARTTGETAFKPVTDTGDWYVWSTSDSASTWRYFGFIDGSRGHVGSTGGSVIEYCFVRSRQYYGINPSGNTTVRYCTANNGVTYGGFYGTLTGISFIYCYGISNGSTIFQMSGAGVTATNCKTECAVSGFTIGAGTGLGLINCVAANCSNYGYILATGTMLQGCTADACVNGIYSSTGTASVYLKDCVLTNNTSYGINLTQIFGVTLDTCTFSSNAIDIATDQYVSALKVLNCSTTTPTSWFIARTLNNAPILIVDCTIDAPSVAKAYQVVTGANYLNPQYILQNSFGLPSGQVYANGIYVEDTTTYRTSAPSMKLVNTGTTTVNFAPLRMTSTYVTGGVAKTMTYYLKRDAGAWAGTIVPQLRLNGKVIKTEPTISSLTTSWVAYTASATSGEINNDGELTLEFIYNANTVAIWIDDVSVA